MINRTRLSVRNSIKKSWSKSFNNGFVYNRVALHCVCTTVPRQYTQLFDKIFTGAAESGRSMGCRNFGNILSNNVPKFHTEKVYVLDKNLSKWSEFYYLEPCADPSITDILKLWTLSFKKDTIAAKTVSQLKCIEELKKLRFTLEMKDMVLHFLVRTWFWLERHERWKKNLCICQY